MASNAALIEEDEFKGRDSTGLMPVSEKTPTEKAELTKYLKMLLLVVPVIGQVLAWSSYLVATFFLGQKPVYDKKFAFIYEYQLGYLFLAVWIVAIARGVLICNANGARGAARVDRPDQHVYKVMSASGPDAYVLMAGTGPQGRFNRAQRGVANTDEALPLFLAELILVGGVFGPLVVVVALLWAYGRVIFGFKYKEDVKARGRGFLFAMIAEKLTEGLILLVAIKGLFFPSISI